MMLSIKQPFILLDDARTTDASPARLYKTPLKVIETRDPDAVSAALDQVHEAQQAGYFAAGFLGYEAGYGLEPKLAQLRRPGDVLPLLWFGIFSDYTEMPAGNVAAMLPSAAGAWIGNPEPAISEAAYQSALAKVHDYIAAGDIYQANLTFQASVKTAGHPLAIYAGLRARAKAGYGGVVYTGTDWLLSLSPELFFALKSGRLTTRPMKGTALRGADGDADKLAVEKLRSDPKQRAENLMIVDLLRNDLSRVAVPGSVEVPVLFAVETYPTVHQMTSTVTAQLDPEKSVIDVIRAIYPCGSITGAPKIRAMEIIDEIETEPRHVYTGTIGRLDPNGDAAFNVAIRTLHLKAEHKGAVIGLGSGIVSDSRASDEWRECLAKGGFVTAGTNFDLIETMAFDPREGLTLLERHLERMKTSAAELGFVFDRHIARNELQAATFRLRSPSRVRLMLSKSGMMAVEIRKQSALPELPVKIGLAALPVDPSDFRLRHKTTDREFYRELALQSDNFDIAMVDPDGFLTEGCFTTIFVQRGGLLHTPPSSRNVLPGVLRAQLLDAGSAIEADLVPADLAKGFFVGNAVRGLLPAKLG